MQANREMFFAHKSKVSMLTLYCLCCFMFHS